MCHCSLINLCHLENPIFLKKEAAIAILTFTVENFQERVSIFPNISNFAKPNKCEINWYNFSTLSLEELTSGSGGLLPIILSLLTSSQVTLDLSSHQSALRLTGNLIAGKKIL